MYCTIEQSLDNKVRVRLEDNMSQGRALPSIKESLMELHRNGFIHQIVDLGGCESLDELQLGALLIANRICQKSGGSFILTGVGDEMRECIHSYSLEQAFTIDNGI